MPTIHSTELYQKLLNKYGYQYWWPLIRNGELLYSEKTHLRNPDEEEAFEIVIGAILAQNTNWINASRALMRLFDRQCMNPKQLTQMERPELAELIRPAGYFNQKAKKIQAWLEFQRTKIDGKVLNLCKEPLSEARRKVLSVWGVGKETADSILLYALDFPVFVIDAYTRRLFSRLEWISGDEDYDFIRKRIESQMEKNTLVYREFHALIVRHCVEYCKNKPLCDACSLFDFCSATNSGGD